MSTAAAKRFYQRAEVGETVAGFGVVLDGRALKTPQGRELALPGQALAAAIADEWRAQGDTIQPRTMPLTALVFTAIDRTGPGRAEVTRHLERFGETDLLCYRASEPGDLIQLQHETWQPLLDWAEVTYGARLIVTAGVLPVAQSEDAVRALAEALTGLDHLTLTALASIAQAAGSLVLGLAVIAGHMGAQEAARVALLDETWQAERWGGDSEAAAQRRERCEDIEAAGRLLALLKAESGAQRGGRGAKRGKKKGTERSHFLLF